MQKNVLYIFCYKLKLFRVEESMREKFKWVNKSVFFNFSKN